MNDLDALEAVARAATQGEWRKNRNTVRCNSDVGDVGVAFDCFGPDATHIATFSPSRILSLTAEIRGLREALGEIAALPYRSNPSATAMHRIARAALAQGSGDGADQRRSPSAVPDARLERAL